MRFPPLDSGHCAPAKLVFGQLSFEREKKKSKSIKDLQFKNKTIKRKRKRKSYKGIDQQ